MKQNNLRQMPHFYYGVVLASLGFVFFIFTVRAEELLLVLPPQAPAMLPDSDADAVLQFAPSVLGVDTQDRTEVLAFYNEQYLPFLDVPIGWTGDQETCAAGTTSVASRAAILQHINYFRAVAGVPANIAFNASFNAKAQRAALMMSAHNRLSHSPTSDWKCFTGAGQEAAGKSTLVLGQSGVRSIRGYFKDYGDVNYAVGHRRWILNPPTQQMGTGDVAAQNGYSASNALWVIDSNIFDSRPETRDDFVAWPPPGYTPYTLVFPRWSFSYPNADFNSATVTMTSFGQTLPVQKELVVDGFGEPTIVWIPHGMANDAEWPLPASDVEYQVKISNVLIGDESRDFSYSVTVIDPTDADPTSTPTWTPLSTFTPPSTGAATGTATDLPTEATTGTPTATAAPALETPTPMETASDPRPSTVTPTWTVTPTPTSTSTSTWTPTPTPTSTPTQSNTPTSSVETATPDPSRQPTATPTSTHTHTPTATWTSTSTVTPTPTYTSTPTVTPTFIPPVTPTPRPTDGTAPRATPVSVPADEETGALEINESLGAPGSYFTIIGSEFPPNGSAVVQTSWGPPIVQLPISADGMFAIIIHTQGAEPGEYVVGLGETIINARAQSGRGSGQSSAASVQSVTFTVDPNGPLLPRVVPPEIPIIEVDEIKRLDTFIYLPAIQK